jgi:hypothetical protein
MADQIVRYEDLGLMGFGRVWELQKGLSWIIYSGHMKRFIGHKTQEIIPYRKMVKNFPKSIDSYDGLIKHHGISMLRFFDANPT